MRRGPTTLGSTPACTTPRAGALESIGSGTQARNAGTQRKKGKQRGAPLDRAQQQHIESRSEAGSVGALRAARPTAFDTRDARYFFRVRSLMIARVPPHADVEQIAPEMIDVVWSSIGCTRRSSVLLPWIHAIASQLVHDPMRRPASRRARTAAGRRHASSDVGSAGRRHASSDLLGPALHEIRASSAGPVHAEARA